MSFTRIFAIAVGAASLAACAQSPVVVRTKSQPVSLNRQAIPEHNRPATTNTHVAVTKKDTASPLEKNPPGGAFGLASFYTEGTQTANGERFNTNAMTAAHRTLPFGTKLRVTRGDRSVIVTINDRGPFVRGRVLDLSTGAARAIGLTSAGVGRVVAEVVS